MKIDDLAKLLGIPELPANIQQVDTALQSLVTTDNSSLREPSLRLVRSEGKRLRPCFVIAAALAQGSKVGNDVITCATAIELVHIGTLVHDDIIDDAELRWGVRTTNAQEGVNHAILVGDYLLALASAQAASVSKEVAYIVATTIAELCDGQSQETADNYNVERSMEAYLETIRNKTAALTSAACRVGAVCANLPHEQVEALAKYGEAFGMAFQITDDLLDFLSTSEAMGKPVGNDIKEGVYTLPVLLALQTEYRDDLRKWLGKNPDSKAQQEGIIETLRRSGVFVATLEEIQKYNEIAAASLSGLEKSKVVVGLASLPDVYLSWALKKQTVLSTKP